MGALRMTAESELAAELRHMIDLLKVEVKKLETELEHSKELSEHRLKQLEKCTEDHETRIRAATDGVTQFKVWSGLASGGSSVMSIIAFVKAFFGG
jgi:hypothetical protein